MQSKITMNGYFVRNFYSGLCNNLYLKPRCLALLSYHVPYNWGSGNSTHQSFTWFILLNWRKSTFTDPEFQYYNCCWPIVTSSIHGQLLAIVTSQWPIISHGFLWTQDVKHRLNRTEINLQWSVLASIIKMIQMGKHDVVTIVSCSGRQAPLPLVVWYARLHPLFRLMAAQLSSEGCAAIGWGVGSRIVIRDPVLLLRHVADTLPVVAQLSFERPQATPVKGIDIVVYYFHVCTIKSHRNLKPRFSHTWVSN